MTEKEVYKNGVALLEEWEDVNYCEHSFKFKNEWLTDKEVVDKLNELAEEKKEIQVQCNLLREQANEFHRGARENANRVGQLEKENQQLKERNNRQCKQLDNLYTLIEKQDWKTLTGLIQEFQECEEQLQKEWSDYE